MPKPLSPPPHHQPLSGAVRLSPHQTTRAMMALAGVLSRHAGAVCALELARCCAMGMLTLDALDLGEARLPTERVIREMLEGRRENFPTGPWGSLTDEQLAELAAAGAVAWDRVARAATRAA